VSWAIEQKAYSQRRACALVGLAPKVYRYRRCSDDGVLRRRLKALAAQRRRFGYRRLHLLLRREGFAVTTRSFSASTERNGSSFASAAVASALLERGHRRPCRRAGTSAGRWTSSRTR